MTVTPIRPEVAPTLDVEREMLDFFTMRLRQYVDQYGEPRSLAIVFVGPDSGASVSEASSWTPTDDNSSRLQCCATASAVLMKRAIGV